jgi:hypothetical protein
MYGVSEAPVHGWTSAGPLTGIVVGVVLLMTCVFVGNLLLGRGAGRQ